MQSTYVDVVWRHPYCTLAKHLGLPLACCLLRRHNAASQYFLLALWPRALATRTGPGAIEERRRVAYAAG
eukprot:scaffold54964_cov30-Tisochrysis_lutea.AAC.7